MIIMGAIMPAPERWSGSLLLPSKTCTVISKVLAKMWFFKIVMQRHKEEGVDSISQEESRKSTSIKNDFHFFIDEVQIMI